MTAAMLTTYEDFIARVETLGFMAFSKILPGLPSLSAETLDNQWHTGLASDPWLWKDRAAEEKRLAYGCILGGHKGFVAPRMYPVFYAAFHPTQPMPARWAAGTLGQTPWRLWQFFEEKGVSNISEVRKAMGASRKSGASAVDAGIVQLQGEYFITVDGNDRKISARGEFYGWPVIRYRRVMDWAPAGWLEAAKDWHLDEARAAILDDGVAMSRGVTRQALAKKLGWS
ncbi:MAG: AlkZ-related protein [Chloroflexota bacterium]